MTTHETRATAFFPTDRELAQMSIAEHAAIHDALQLAAEVIAGVMIQPRCADADADSGMNAAGDALFQIQDDLLGKAGRVVDAAVKRRHLESDDRKRRALLFMSQEVACGDGADLAELALALAPYPLAERARIVAQMRACVNVG